MEQEKMNIKQIILNILKEETQDFSLKVYYGSKINFFSEAFFLSTFPIKTRLKGLKYLQKELKNCKGFYNNRTNILAIFPTNSLNQEKNFVNAIEIAYHEIRHIEQKEFSPRSLYGHLNKIEHQLEGTQYNPNHNFSSFEIGANLYAIRKTKEFLKKNYPNIYQKAKIDLEKREYLYLFIYFFYNPTQTICNYIKEKRKQYQKYLNHTLSSPPTLNEVSAIFLKENFEFKDLDDILKNKKIYQIEKEIIYGYLGNKLFLNTIAKEEIEESKLLIVNRSLYYNAILLKAQQQSSEKYRKLYNQTKTKQKGRF